MKNAKYYPFERNKYFYGKLLSVDDFELEQRYTNNKHICKMTITVCNLQMHLLYWRITLRLIRSRSMVA